MRGALHNGFSRHMRRMRSRTSRETDGRPQRRGRDFQVQKRRKPLRCRPITVAGLTIARASRQFGQKLEIRTQNKRSDGWSRGRGVFRSNTASCWCTAKFSKYEAANAGSRRFRRATRSRESIFAWPKGYRADGRKARLSASYGVLAKHNPSFRLRSLCDNAEKSAPKFSDG
jgi:hypothetical protein